MSEKLNPIASFFIKLFAGSVSMALVAAPVPAQAVPHEPHSFLQKYLGFTKADLSALDRGQVVTKLPKTGIRHEVATFGIVRLNAPREALVTQFRDIVNFKKSANVPQIGKFSNPPTLEDLRGLILDDDDLSAIRDCRVGDCDVKLSAETIERFRRQVNWSAPNYREHAGRLFRQMLIDYVKAYLKGGNAALGDYRDKQYPLKLADEFRSLLRESPYIYEYAPEFHKYLEQFPNMKLPGTEDFIYWSKEAFGYRSKAILSLTHVTIYQRKQGDSTNVMIASKQIYASHYFETSLGLTAYVNERGGSGARNAYLLYLNRSRTDVLRGRFSGMKRSAMTGSLRSATRDNLLMIKRRLEAAGSTRR